MARAAFVTAGRPIGRKDRDARDAASGRVGPMIYRLAALDWTTFEAELDARWRVS